MSTLARMMVAIFLLLIAGSVCAERVKDIARVAGVRSNPLVGYGLVVGLDGTGDQTSQAPFTVQSLKSMMSQLGITVPEGVNPQLKNVAAVAIHSELPAFSRPGQMIDVTVSSIGNSGSLRGGSLLMTPLRGADGQVYAIAQGNVVVGGFGVSGQDGSRVSVNVPSSGRIPNGGQVERAVATGFETGDTITLELHRADFTTAQRVVVAINQTIGTNLAKPADAGAIVVQAPTDAGDRIAFMSMLENIELIPGDAPAKVIINSRTGTIVIGANVKVMPAAVAHGSLTVTIAERSNVSQPEAFSGGETVVTPQSGVTVESSGSRMFLLQGGTSLDAIVRAVNEVGAAPGDVVAILEALHRAGALRAELEVI